METNNEAEWISLYYGMYLVRKINIAKIIVIRDSRKVIHKMNNRSNKGIIKSKIIYECIQHISGETQDSYIHIIRGNNAEVDKITNQGFKTGMGMTKVNETLSNIFMLLKSKWIFKCLHGHPKLNSKSSQDPLDLLLPLERRKIKIS